MIINLCKMMLLIGCIDLFKDSNDFTNQSYYETHDKKFTNIIITIQIKCFAIPTLFQDIHFIEI